MRAAAIAATVLLVGLVDGCGDSAGTTDGTTDASQEDHAGDAADGEAPSDGDVGPIDEGGGDIADWSDVPGEADGDILPADADGEEAPGDADGGSGDGGRTLPATMTDEMWHEGSTVCSTPSLLAESPVRGRVVVSLLQIPADDVRGTCIGHTAAATLAGSDISIVLDGPTGSACWTACWDFEVTVTGVPGGTYTVRFLGLSDDVSVAWPPT